MQDDQLLCIMSSRFRRCLTARGADDKYLAVRLPEKSSYSKVLASRAFGPSSRLTDSATANGCSGFVISEYTRLGLLCSTTDQQQREGLVSTEVTRSFAATRLDGQWHQAQFFLSGLQKPPFLT